MTMKIHRRIKAGEVENREKRDCKMPLVAEDFFLTANLSPMFTGLPFVVWISMRGNARHDIRVKVSRGLNALEMISVALSPELGEIGGKQLKPEELQQLGEW